MKNKFIEIYKEWITRPGSEELLKWLESSDFFTAPASTRYHLSRPCGLVEHSIHVYERLLQNCRVSRLDKNAYGDVWLDYLNADEMEFIAIVGLLHDVCKANFYGVEMRNRKNEFGQWEKYPFYIVDDQLPYGHGEKSVYIISSFMRLTRDEAMAIRWHMGFSDNEFKAGGQTVSKALGKYPMALMAHIADLQATFVDELEGEDNG